MKRTSKIRNIIIHKFHVWQEKMQDKLESTILELQRI